MTVKEVSTMTGKVFSKNDNWYIKFEDGTTRRFYKTNFFGDFGYVSFNGKKTNVVIDFNELTARTLE